MWAVAKKLTALCPHFCGNSAFGGHIRCGSFGVDEVQFGNKGVPPVTYFFLFPGDKQSSVDSNDL
jgi:hypothetical protein